MKVVIFSDAHGNRRVVNYIIDNNPDADYFLSLGDDELPQDYMINNDIIMIRGNSNHDSGFVYERELDLEGLKLFLTHGHKYSVHKGLNKLGKHAVSNNYDIVLYGHTHILDITKIGKVQFLNPGSCARPRNTLPPTYMILDIEEGDYKVTIKDSIDNRTIEV